MGCVWRKVVDVVPVTVGVARREFGRIHGLHYVVTWQAGRQSWEFARAWPLHWLHLEIAPRAVLQHHSSQPCPTAHTVTAGVLACCAQPCPAQLRSSGLAPTRARSITIIGQEAAQQ